MRRRITAAIVGVAAFVVVVLGVPLGIVVQRAIVRSELVSLDGDAARTLAEIDLPLDPAQLATVGGEVDAPPPFGVYTPDGALLFGSGPPSADAVTLTALRLGTANSSDGELVVATQLVDRHEVVQGVLRLAESRREPDARTRDAWLVMAGAATLALGGAWLIARRLARQLTRPLAELSAAADDLATGVTREPLPSTGVAEIDDLAAALHHGADRITEALARERRFSDDVSHQLRTPLTGLRLHLEEAASGDAGSAALDGALADLARVEHTVTDLLAFARGTQHAGAPVGVAAIVNDVAARRRGSGRRVHVIPGPDVQVHAASPALTQALDVLVDNAVRHGTGSVTIEVRQIAGGVAIDVRDEGSVPHDVDEAALFERGSGTDHGIGLALARDLVEAEGGRLGLTRRQPTTFTLTLLAVDPVVA